MKLSLLTRDLSRQAHTQSCSGLTKESRQPQDQKHGNYLVAFTMSLLNKHFWYTYL